LNFHFGIVFFLRKSNSRIPGSTKINKLPEILSDGIGRKVGAVGVFDQSDQSANNTSDSDLVTKQKLLNEPISDWFLAVFGKISPRPFRS